MERVYTKEQNNAISDRGHTLLVSAAAGSGKTTVLIDRIVGIVTDEKEPVELDRLLVVTYTKAAAAEIRDRLSVALSKALSENPSSRRLLRQLAMVPSAKIDTMDAFFLDVIRKNFDKAGLPASFSVCDEGTSDIMLTSVCEELTDEYYENEPEDSVFFKLIENLSTASDDSRFGEILKGLYKKIFSFADPEEYLDFCISEYERLASGELDYTKSRFFCAIEDSFSLMCEHALDEVREALSIVQDDPSFANYAPAIENLCSSLEAVKSAKNYDEIYKAVSGYQKMSLKAVRNADAEIKEFITGARDDGDKFIAASRELFCLSGEDLRACCEEYFLLARFIKELLIKLDMRFTRLKKSKGLINFADMKRLCYGLLFEKKDGVRVPTELAREVARDYKEIFIDEYQDTDGIQDEIFSSLAALSGAKRFMVGDMKQCIYAFRGSEPKLFARYYDAFPFIEQGEGGEAKIALSDNFRSDESVIKTVNTVFKSLMRKRLSDIDYGEDQALKKGKNTDAHKEAELFITKVEKREKTANVCRKQAASCAKEIARLIYKEGYAPEDIAVLTRFNKHIPVYKKALSELGIEVRSADSIDIFTAAEVRLVRAVLYAVDNPARDVHLASALCSPVFSLTLTDLAKLRLFERGSLYEALLASKDQVAQNAAAYLKELKKFSLSATVDKLIFKIIKDSGLDRAVKKEKNGIKRYENLLRFISLSKTYNSGSYRGLSDFLSYCESLEKTSSPMASDRSGAGVTVSTMHASKGLEYKVCFVAGCETDLFGGKHAGIIYDAATPFAFTLMRQDGFVKLQTPPVAALKHLNRYKPVSEEMRLLYVALTRAKEKLYISFAQNEEALGDMLYKIDTEQSPADDHFILAGKTHLELILRGIAAGRKESLEEIFYRDMGIESWLKVRFAEDGDFEDMSFSAENAEKKAYEAYPDYIYPHAERALIPAKISVSDIDSDGERENPKLKGELPSFMAPSHATAAQKGTAMHNFMQFCDYENAAWDVRAEAERMARLGFISSAQTEILDYEALSGFFKSELYKEMKNARRIYREQRYNLLESASKYYESADAEGQNLLIQGVIDCFFENAEGEIVLVDFKTDRVGKEDGADILRTRHTPQLLLYSQAVERMLNKKLSKAYVYSFALGKEILCI